MASTEFQCLSFPSVICDDDDDDDDSAVRVIADRGMNHDHETLLDGVQRGRGVMLLALFWFSTRSECLGIRNLRQSILERRNLPFLP
jgi:hypothetical protein